LSGPTKISALRTTQDISRFILVPPFFSVFRLSALPRTPRPLPFPVSYSPEITGKSLCSLRRSGLAAFSPCLHVTSSVQAPLLPALPSTRHLMNLSLRGFPSLPVHPFLFFLILLPPLPVHCLLFSSTTWSLKQEKRCSYFPLRRFPLSSGRPPLTHGSRLTPLAIEIIHRMIHMRLHSFETD